jgi:uncharacterized membrane protein YgcG
MFFISLICCVFVRPSVAQASSESIISFSAQAIVDVDRMMTVTETIVYSFGSADRHGIYRMIPETYSRNGGTYRLRLSVKSVKMDGSSVDFKITSRTPNLRIQIGDADKTITGTHEYQITYQTDHAINFFDDHDELYWNVTGNGWTVPIGAVSFSVRGPNGFDAEIAKKDCFIGLFGSTERACNVNAQGSTVTYQTSRPFTIGEGMAVVLALPKGLMTPETWFQKLMDFIKNNGIAVLPIMVFIFMFKLWYEKGREPEGRGTVVPQYEPPREMTPMEMAALEKQKNEPRTITATIIDLARRGYLRIIFEEKKGIFGNSQSYAFEKLKDADEHQPSHEKILLSGLFKDGMTRTEMSSLKGSYYQSISKAHSAVFTLLHTKGFFGQSVVTVRGTYSSVAVVIGFFGMFIASSFGLTIIWSIALVLSAIIIGVFGWFMPSKTKEGAIALEEVQGFKWFLSVTEADRLTFHNAPALKPEKFHEFLSYAIAFGVETQWANQFKDLMVPEPEYISGYHYMNPLLFVHSMNSFETDLAKSFTPPSSAGSGGSGFSGGGVGGGFGGGGGGSW